MHIDISVIIADHKYNMARYMFRVIEMLMVWQVVHIEAEQNYRDSLFHQQFDICGGRLVGFSFSGDNMIPNQILPEVKLVLANGTLSPKNHFRRNRSFL